MKENWEAHPIASYALGAAAVGILMVGAVGAFTLGVVVPLAFLLGF